MNTRKLLEGLPEMKTGVELIQSLISLPDYDPDICKQDKAVRLTELSDLYDIFIPSQMALEIYSKLYLALLRSLQKKETKLATVQRNENHKLIIGNAYSGIIGGSDSFTIIGQSGIGKSTAIARAIKIITENRILETTVPYQKIVPCIIVQCPYDSSVKGLLLEILRKTDETLQTDYYKMAIKNRATTDTLIGAVSQVALNHIALLIVDEIQNVVNSRNGKNIIGSLTQLINNSGISICMVGMPESEQFFGSAMQLARRSLGLNYGALEYGEDYKEICRILFRYQFTRKKVELTEAIQDWLYEHSGGNISVLVSLWHDAQELAILQDHEIADMEMLNEAYQKRMTLLHPYLNNSDGNNRGRNYRKPKKTAKASDFPMKDMKSDAAASLCTGEIEEIVQRAKDSGKDVICLMKTSFTVEELPL